MKFFKLFKDRLWVSLFLLTFVFQILIGLILGKMLNPTSAIALQFAFTTEQFLSIVTEWSASEKSQFLNHYWLDFVYPAVYSSFLIRTAKLVQSGNSKSTKFAMISAFLAGSFDVGENSLHLVLVNEILAQQPFAICTAALFATLKWVLIAVSLLILVPKLSRP